MRRISLLCMLAVILTLTWAPAQARAQQIESLSYIAQPADTSLDLSLFYRASLESLGLGSIQSPENTLASGQAIRIPRGSTAVAALPPAPTAPLAETPTYHIVQQGDTLFRIATRYGVPLNALAAVNNLASPDHIYVGQQLTLPPPGASSLDYPPLPTESPAPGTGGPILPPEFGSLGAGKEILVVLSTQMAYAYEDGVLLRQFVVSTGLPATPTVQGHFAIYIKMPSQRMVGPDYDLPNVPWVMYFYQGYGLHGTYWHNNFGHPMSHGCVNMRTPEAEWLYNWAPLGTPVDVIY